MSRLRLPGFASVIAAVATLGVADVAWAQTKDELVASAITTGKERAAAAVAHFAAQDWETYRGDRGVVVAEGDSWFDYPRVNVLKVLRRQHQYRTESVARNGDTLESMAYDNAQLSELCDKLYELRDLDVKPKAILLSGGGNDLAGPEFAMLLNHANSGLPPVSEEMVDYVIETRLQAAVASLLSGVTEISTKIWGEPIPILIHGYDYPTPDGRGYEFLLFTLSGPWLKPSFDAKGLADLPTNRTFLRELIEKYNRMLVHVTSQFGHVRYVKITGTLSDRDVDYEDDWNDELHPSRGRRGGFFKVAQEFHQVLQRLP